MPDRKPINKKYVKEMYTYLAKALREERLFNKNFPRKEEAEKLFTQLKLPSDTGTQLEKESFYIELQSWTDAYLCYPKWKRCLSTLRQNRSTRKHRVYSLKIDHKIYVLLRQYAKIRQLTMQQAIYEAILPYVYVNPNAYDTPAADEAESNEANTSPFKITVF